VTPARWASLEARPGARGDRLEGDRDKLAEGACDAAGGDDRGGAAGPGQTHRDSSLRGDVVQHPNPLVGAFASGVRHEHHTEGLADATYVRQIGSPHA
jgi:hypothetical protein